MAEQAQGQSSAETLWADVPDYMGKLVLPLFDTERGGGLRVMQTSVGRSVAMLLHKNLCTWSSPRGSVYDTTVLAASVDSSTGQLSIGRHTARRYPSYVSICPEACQAYEVGGGEVVATTGTRAPQTHPAERSNPSELSLYVQQRLICELELLHGVEDPAQDVFSCEPESLKAAEVMVVDLARHNFDPAVEAARNVPWIVRQVSGPHTRA